MCAHLGTRYAETDQCDQCLERTARDEAATDPRPCPECRAGKCGNCDGSTWDVDRDEYADCPCATAGHGCDCAEFGSCPQCALLAPDEAATVAGVTVYAIRKWARLGILPARGRVGNSPRYLEIDVLRVELDMRRRGGRRAS